MIGEKLRRDNCFNTFKGIYHNCADIERKGIEVKGLSFEKLKEILADEYRVPQNIDINRYVAMCKSVVNGNTIFEDRN